MRATKTMILACTLALAGTPATAVSQTSSIERALERAAEAVERAMEAMGEGLDRALSNRGRNEPGRWTRAAEDFRWTGTLAEGRILEIKGVNGAVRVEPAAGRQVVVEARSRGRRNDPSEVRIERVEHAEGVTFCAVYPTPGGERENVCRPGAGGRMNVRDNDVEVTFTVRLPEGVRFAGQTVNGSIEAQGLASDVSLRTVNGDVEVATTGFAEARTVNGSIDAAMGRTDPEGGLRFETVNGSIELDLPDDVDADVEANWLNGGLETDLPLRVEGRIGRRSARGVLGEGGPRLELSTVNGSIRLR
jgi:hypothetical protein